MKIIKWIIGVLFALGFVAITASYFFIKFMGPASTLKEYTENVGEVMKSSLDTPFLFILDIRDLSPDYLVKDSDIFSTWGHLQLRYNPGKPSDKSRLINDITQTARKYHWQLDNADPEDIDLQDVMDREIDFASHGINHTTPDLVFSQTATSANNSQGPPTRYLSRLWISEDNFNLIMSFRVDSE